MQESAGLVAGFSSDDAFIGAEFPLDDFRRGGGPVFWGVKRLFDITVALLGGPFIILLALFLSCLNPIWSRGPLLYRQHRMGVDGKVMVVFKFRSMCPAEGGASRGPDDPLEEDRITPLGRWLRRTRLDELPQLVNVLLGEMSLIGPRPDCVSHANAYSEMIPGYRERHIVRPGISGLAQVTLGYAEGFDVTAQKTRLDLAYIRQAGWKLEAIIVWRTLLVITTGFGAR